MEIVGVLLVFLAFVAIFLIDLPNLIHLPDKNKNLTIYIAISFLGFLLSVLQILNIISTL